MKQFNDYFDNIPYLETERFILVPFMREDMEEYFDILRDDRVQKYLGGGVPLFDKEPNITNIMLMIVGEKVSLLKSRQG